MAHRRRANDLSGHAGSVGRDDDELLPAHVTALEAYLALARELFVTLERRTLGAGGLSFPDWELAAVLADADASGLRPSELAERAHWPSSRVAHQVRRMENRGLVERLPHPDDGRGKLVRLTREGRRATDEVFPVFVDSVRTLIVDAMSPHELDVWGERCRAILDRVRASESGDNRRGTTS